jgi:hypothetical protein
MEVSLDKKIRNSFEDQIQSLLDELVPEIAALRKKDLDRLGTLLNRIDRQYDGFLTKKEEGDEAIFKWLETISDLLSSLSEDQVLSGYFGGIRGRVQNWSQSQNIFSVYPQHQRCFAPHPDDTLWLSSAKRLKRTGLTLQTAAYRFAGILRQIIKKDRLDDPVWTHSVSWGVVAAILKNQLLRTIIEWIDEDLRLRRDLALVLVAINDLQGKPDSDKKEAREIAETIRRISKTLQSRTTGMVDQMRLELYEIFQETLPKIYHFDTLTVDRSFFDTARISSEYEKHRLAFGENVRQWDADLNIRLSQLRIDIGFYRFSKNIQTEVDNLTQTITAPFRSHLQQDVERIRLELVQTADRFDKERLNRLSRASLLKKIRESSGSLLTLIKDDFFSRISAAIDTLSYVDALDQAMAQVLLHNHLLASDTSVFAKPVNPVPIKPVTEVEMVDFRHEMTVYLNHELFRELASLPPLFSQRLHKLRILAAEIIQVVEVNLEVAEDLSTDDSETSLDEIYDLVHDGLGRAAGRAEDLISALEEYVREAENAIAKPVTGFLELCFRIMREDDYLYIRTRNREVRVKYTALDWRAKLQKRLDLTRHEGRLRLRQGVIVLGGAYHWLLSMFGFESASGTKIILKTEASVFLSNIDKRLTSLPLIYRKLFSAEPLDEPRFYRGRTQLSELFKAAVSTWLEGKPVNFAVIGEKGSGKTTALNLLITEIPENTRVYSGVIDKSIGTERELLNIFGNILGFKQLSSSAELIDRLHGMKNRPVIILEGFQNLYLRHVDGFEAMEAFLLIISSTSQNCFWVVSGSRYGWELMSKIYQVESYFTHLRMVDVVNSATIKEIIMARHSVSGYELRFEPGDGMSMSRTYRRLRNNDEGQQQLVSDEYFRELNVVCQGNIAIALLYWQMSIRKTDLETVYVAPVGELVTQLGDGFTNDDLFALSALLQHDDLSAEQLALVLNKDAKLCQMILSRLASRAILLNNEGYFMINYLLYRPIVDILKSKNIIH